MFKFSLFQLFAVVAFLFPHTKQTTDNSSIEGVRALKLARAVNCIPDRETINAMIDEQEIYLLPGSGSYVWKIDTKNDSAQLYFNQGINTYYGFHIIESKASFKKAAKLDPGNPMVWWAQALADGPNINDVAYSASPEALEAVKKATELIDKANPVERSLIEAMQVRYSADTTMTREVLNQKYVDAMKAAYEKHTESADVAALYADAMMLQHPWDLWEVGGTPKPWTPVIRNVIEKALPTAGKHPGLNHYYIHVMEPSPTPSAALASADVLGSITPGLAHLVHMPSHIYLRTGQLNKGVAINADAVQQYHTYNSMYPAVAASAFLYEWHNRHMLVNCAMHAGKYNTAISVANELSQSVDTASLASPAPLGSLVQYIYMTPVLILVRFEKWDSLLAMKKPDNILVYANLLYEFGQGMAKSGKGMTSEARQHVDRIDELIKNEDLQIEMKPFSAAIEGARTARELLVGAIHIKEKHYKDAIDHLTVAVDVEKQMVYNEPRDWFLNPRPYLGLAYLLSGDFAKAEQQYSDDLNQNANNVWSLRGLMAAQEKQKKKKQAFATGKILKASTGESDVDFSSMFY